MPAPADRRRPRRFDTNLAVIGAGAAGLVAAYVAAAARARVTLIERERMGGDCLNTGCVPSKSLIRVARLAADIRRAGEFGLHAGEPRVDFTRVMERVREVITRIEPHDSVERYTALGVDCVQGDARITSPWSVLVDGREIRARALVVATGGRPFVPPIDGLADAAPLTSDTVWQLESLPERLLVLGGGPIGCELGQAFARLGSHVTIVEMSPRLLAREDPEAAAAVTERFAAEGVEVLTSHEARRFEAREGQRIAVCQGPEGVREIPFDQVLVAVGRRARTEGLGLDAAGIETDADGTLTVNEYLQTTAPSVYACGDVAGPFQLTHAGAHQAWYCTMNALLGGLWRFRADYRVIPRGIFTEPEVAHVGLTAGEAEAAGVDVEVTRYGVDDLDRAIAEGEAHGFVKVLTQPGSDRILGATVVGPQATELITEHATAMKHGLGLRGILGTLHAYPTLSEANRFAAGAWQRAHLSPRLLDLAERFHRWRR